jgi:hypothetical protein
MPTAPATSRGDLDLLRDYLASHDALCPSCRHNLHGAAGPACPECGVGLDLKLTLADPAYAAWATTLIIAAATLGFSGPLAFASLYARAIAGLSGREPFTGNLALVAAFLSVGVLIALLRARAAMVRRPRPRQWFVSIAIAVFLLGVHAVLFMLFTDVGVGYLYPD